MAIKFELNSNKAQQVLLWILNKKPGIHIYNIMKVVFEAERYHLNNYASPIYGDSYEAWKYGTVPTFMYHLANIRDNVLYFRSDCDSNALRTNTKPDMDVFSATEIEALEHGFSEYGNLGFQAALEKNHQQPVWKKHEKDVLAGVQHIQIPYEDSDFIRDSEIVEYLQDISQAMVL